MPVPTIGDLMRDANPNWVWVHCVVDCSHAKPMTLAQFAIRWGMDASSDKIRSNLRCSLCGRRGATIRCVTGGHNGLAGAPPVPG